MSSYPLLRMAPWFLVCVACGGAPATTTTTTSSQVVAHTTPVGETIERTEVNLDDAEIQPGMGAPPEAEGMGTTAAGITAMNSLQSQIVDCYQKGLSENSAVAGKVDIEIDLKADGTAASVRVFPDDGLDTVSVCLRETLQGIHMASPDAARTRLVRSYRFVNPVTKLDIETALTIAPPARAARARRGRHGAAAAEATPVAPTTDTPATGALQSAEVSTLLSTTGMAPMQACYGTLLAAQKKTTGTSRLKFEISTTGEVTTVELAEINMAFPPARRRGHTDPAAAAEAARTGLKTCTETAVKALHFRAAGIRAAVTIGLNFGAPPAAAGAAPAGRHGRHH